MRRALVLSVGILAAGTLPGAAPLTQQSAQGASELNLPSSPLPPRGQPGDQANANDQQTVFRYTEGTFIRSSAQNWVEDRDRGVDSQFTETVRSEEYVELYDKDRDMLVRLYSDHGEWSARTPVRWARWPGSEGFWVK